MPYDENGQPADEPSTRIDAIAGRGTYIAVLLLTLSLFPVGAVLALATMIRRR